MECNSELAWYSRQLRFIRENSSAEEFDDALNEIEQDYRGDIACARNADGRRNSRHGLGYFRRARPDGSSGAKFLNSAAAGASAAIDSAACGTAPAPHTAGSACGTSGAQRRRRPRPSGSSTPAGAPPCSAAVAAVVCAKCWRCCGRSTKPNSAGLRGSVHRPLTENRSDCHRDDCCKQFRPWKLRQLVACRTPDPAWRRFGAREVDGWSALEASLEHAAAVRLDGTA